LAAEGPGGRLARLALLGWVVLVPLAMWTGFADTVETPKRLILGSLSCLLAGMAAFVPGIRARLLGAPLAGPLTAMGFAAALSAWASVAPGLSWAGEEGSWAGAASLVAVWGGVLAGSCRVEPGRHREILVAFLVAAGCAAAYTVIQAAGLDPIEWNPGLRGRYWLFGTLGNPVHLANLLACAFWATFAFRSGTGTWILRAFLLAAALATRQRSVWLALAGGAAALWWIRRGTGRERGGVRLRAEAVLAAFAAASATAAASAPGLLRLFDVLRPGSRLEIWRAVLKLTRSHPLLGAGPDLLHTHFPAVAGYGFFVADPPSIAGTNVLLRLPAAAHNEPLGMAAAGGVVLLGLYAWALVTAVRAGSRSPLLPAAASLWFVHLVNPASAATGSLFWLLVALSASRPGSRPAAEPRGASSGVRGAIPPVAAAIGAAAVLFACLASLECVIGQAHRREAGRLAFAGDREGLARHLRRWDAWAARGGPGLALADAALWRARWEADPKDREALDRALSLLRAARLADPAALFPVCALADLERVRGQLGRDPGALRRAEDLLRAAIGMAPAVASLHGDLAEVLDLEGRRREAAAERAEQSRRDPAGVFRAATR